MHALVIANGPLPPKDRFARAIDAADLILCADGGANRAVAAGITPHFVVGDFDSLSDGVRAHFAPEQLVHRPSQYATDLEKTLQFAVDQNCTAATVLGLSGGRLDHQICNLNMLEKFSDRLAMTCIDENGTGYIVRDTLRLRCKIGQQVSIFAFRRAGGITTRGLRYPLQDATMEWAVNDGLSNEAIAELVEIRVANGCLFVYCVHL